MFCNKCGATIDANSVICPVCGQPVDARGASMPPPLPTPPMAMPVTNPSVQTGKWISEGWAIVQTELPMFALLTLIVAAVGSAVPVIIHGAMQIGFHIAIMKKLRTGKLDLGDCFKGFEFFVPSMIAAIIIGVFVFLGTLACIIPGVILYAMYQFTYLFIFDKKLDFWPAMQASSDLVKKDLMGFTLFAFALMGLNLAGALACGIGIFITVPISAVAVTLAYRDLVGFDPSSANL